MATVQQVRFAPQKGGRGVFHCEKFNLFDDDDREAWASLRTQAEDRTSGISIENVQGFNYKTQTQEGEGPERVTTTSEEYCIIVEYWVNEPKNEKGDIKDAQEAKKSWIR